MDEILAAYRMQGGATFDVRYGPSGKLRQEIENGMLIDVFASASTGHTEELAGKNLLGPSRVFTYNELCVIARPQLNICEENVLDMLMTPSVRVATSTPVSDPMGDYTWEFFRRADTMRPGFHALLDGKAIRLSGAAMPAPGAAYLPYITAFTDDRADVYIAYRTNARIVSHTLPELDIVRIPQTCNVHSTYGIAARPDSADGRAFVKFALSTDVQHILQRHGFG
ncbi:molybdate ABC transporter substrate-binding protein [Oxalicibacterium solurbis]|uniref:Molybdate ABC transporter substrate-binding protein n=2 Tax=Oxalicibacterium solurbis TaxID=69280 RepID=A0A8J3F4E5_9BURK|nr:molybdate ABC transporter substrate-binding protein [Oxalicibacterium solurbis]